MPILIGIIVCVFLIILRELEKSENRKILDKAKDMSFINKELESIQRKQQLNRGLNMTREEQIKQAAESNLDVSFYTPQDGELLKETFYIGAKWADEHPQSPWISVKDDLPCNHEELIVGNLWTRETIVFNGDDYYFDRMSLIEGKWYWESNRRAKFWFIIPKLPKE